VDLFDKVALWGRRYERQVNPRTGNTRFSLSDLLEVFRHNTILELTPVTAGKPQTTARPDPVRKLKVSILDQGVSALGDAPKAWYEVWMTAPSGDLARARVVAYGPDGAVAGSLRMLIAQRDPDLYFREDPILSALAEEAKR